MKTHALSFAVAVLLGALSLDAAAEPQLQVADLTPFTLQDDPQQRPSILVYPTGGPLYGLQASVLEVKDPDGQSLPATLLAVSPESTQVGEQGTRVYLKPELSAFRRPGDYLAVLFLHTGPVAGGTGKAGAGPSTSQMLTVTLRREPPALHAEPLSVRLQRPLPWRPARLQVPYTIENWGQRPLHELSVDAQPVTQPSLHPQTTGTHREAVSEQAPGSLTVVLPPPPAGQVLQRQRTGQGIELPASGRLDLALLFTDLSSVGRFQTALTLRSAELGTPQLLPITIEVSDRWEFALLAVGLGCLIGFLLQLLGGRWRPLTENRHRIAHLAIQMEDIRPTGQKSANARASLSEKLRRAAQRNQDGEAALCHRLLDEIETEFDAYFETENELRAAVRERIDQAQGQTRSLLDRRGALTPEQNALLQQTRLDLERVSALATAGQFEAADTALQPAHEQLYALRRALTVAEAGAQAPAEPTTLTATDGRPLRIEVLEPPARWKVGSAIRVRAIDDRQGRGELEQYIWRFGDGASEPGATEVEFPLDKAGDLEIMLQVRRPDLTEAAAARRSITVLSPRAPADLDVTNNPKLRVHLFLTLLALALAGTSGVYLLCFSVTLQPLVGPAFGTPGHYLFAVGFGLAVDLVLRGFADLLVRLSADS